MPYLAIQPLVENAVRHGLEGKEGVGHVSITASDHGAEAEIVIEDDGVGSDPELVRAALAGAHRQRQRGLGNVDARLRQVYGDDRRPGRRDRAGRRHQGDLPGAQVRARRAPLGRNLAPCPTAPA